MAEPQINKHWWNDNHFPLRPFLAVGIPVFILALALILSTMKGYGELGKSGKQDVFMQPEDEGFVGKTNDLLEELLSQVDEKVQATDLESLNKRYPALEFALPYGEDHKPVIEASDLRLVDIHVNNIKDEKDRDFYYNSRLPQLLRQQREQMAESFFEIKVQGTKYDAESQTKPIVLKSVKLHAAMFKVALSKNPWKGTIKAKENCLFNDSNAVFLTYGTSMVPIPKVKTHTLGASSIKVKALMDKCMLVMSDEKPVDYYNIYKSAFDRSNPDCMKSLKIEMHNPGDNGSQDCILQISASQKSLVIVSSSKKVIVHTAGKAPVTINGAINSQVKNDSVPLSDGMKIAAYDASDHKLGEFTIHMQDPTRVLSSLIQTNLGTSRYNIPQDQTDLFTQQMIRGLSRHLSEDDSISEVHLSIDPMLSLEFEKQVEAYVHKLPDMISHPANQVNEQYDMSVTIMDIATGEVLATPFYTSKFDPKDYPEDLKMTTRNVSLSRRYIGSTFKPFVALAAVEANPNLLGLDTDKKYSIGSSIGNSKKNEATFFGHKTIAWAVNTGHWTGTDFESFLAMSDDVYPVALAAIAMTGENVSNTLPMTGENNFFQDKNGLHFKKTFVPPYKTHPFTHWITHLTSVNDDSYDYSEYLDPFCLLKASEKSQRDSISQSFGIQELTPDVVNMHFNLFGDGAEFRSELVPWVLGQGNNEWNCVTMAQAWSRLIGRRNVVASYLDTRYYKHDEFCSLATSTPGCNTTGGTARDKAAVDVTWNAFLDKLSAAPGKKPRYGKNTLIKMKTAVDKLNTVKGQDPFVLFCKTGTPDMYCRYDQPLMGGNNRYIDIGMFSFVLAPQSSVASIKAGKQGHGIACIVRLTRTYQCVNCLKRGKACEACKQKSAEGLSSSNARDFFAASDERMRMLYDMTKKYYN